MIFGARSCDNGTTAVISVLKLRSHMLCEAFFHLMLLKRVYFLHFFNKSIAIGKHALSPLGTTQGMGSSFSLEKLLFHFYFQLLLKFHLGDLGIGFLQFLQSHLLAGFCFSLQQSLWVSKEMQQRSLAEATTDLPAAFLRSQWPLAFLQLLRFPF